MMTIPAFRRLPREAGQALPAVALGPGVRRAGAWGTAGCADPTLTCRRSAPSTRHAFGHRRARRGADAVPRPCAVDAARSAGRLARHPREAPAATRLGTLCARAPKGSFGTASARSAGCGPAVTCLFRTYPFLGPRADPERTARRYGEPSGCSQARRVRNQRVWVLGHALATCCPCAPPERSQALGGPWRGSMPLRARRR